MERYVFYIETKKTLEGKQTIFADLAVRLSRRKNSEVFYVNDFYGDDLDRFKNSGVQCSSVNDFAFDDFDGAIFFIPINNLLHLLMKISKHKTSKIMLYVYNEDSPKWLLSHFGKKADTSELQKLLQQSQCCYYSDLECYAVSGQPNETYLPVPYDTPYYDNCPNIIDKDTINIGYYGTLLPQRRNALYKLLDDLKNLSINKKINFHIVGDSRHFFSVNIGDASQYNCRFYCTGKMDDENSCDYIRKNVDIIFANNENAVKAASFGVPVVVPVISSSFKTPIAVPIIESEEINNNAYVLFCDIFGYCYAWDYDKLIKLGYERRSLSNILDIIYTQQKKCIIGKKCNAFFTDNCSIDTVTDNFIKYASETKLTVESCLRLSVIREGMEKFSAFLAKHPMIDFNGYLEYNKYGKLIKNQCDNSQQKLSVFDRLRNNKKEKDLQKAYNEVQDGYPKKIEALREIVASGKKIKVVFIVLFKSVFPTRPVYELMLKDPMFDPYIVVVPNVFGTYKYMLTTYFEAFNALTEAYGERVIGAYDVKNDEYLDFADDYSIAFFCNPYKHLVNEKHHVEYFLDKNVLPIYSSYGFAALKFWDEVIAMPFYNYMWKCTLETPSNLLHLQQTEIIKGRNGVVTGYLKMDTLPNANVYPRDRKRILICPHHTVWGDKALNIGTFLTYCDYYVELPKMFPDVDFVFRPHPLLLTNLQVHHIWTHAQVEEYMERLLSSPNITYDTSSDYMEQFANSDAMIHDCGSFIGEYLYTKKPCLYLLKSKDAVESQLVPLGQQCMAHYYHAFTENDITSFIRDVVIGGNDPLKEEREEFVEKELMVNYPHASESVVKMIKDELQRR